MSRDQQFVCLPCAAGDSGGSAALVSIMTEVTLDKVVCLCLIILQCGARQVVLRYDDTTVLDKVSLSLPPGQLSCLLGPSGCGKTSLLKVCTGCCVS